MKVYKMATLIILLATAASTFYFFRDFNTSDECLRKGGTWDYNTRICTYRMHPSWDENKDGLNDCEDEGACGHTIDYSQPRKS